MSKLPLRSLLRRAAAVWLLCAMAATPGLAKKPAAPAIEGTVQRVVDGDSLWLQPVAGGDALHVRLLGIDAPEICQPWGLEARQALQELVLKRAVSLHPTGHDTYGRTLGTLYLDTLNVNKSMVQEGHAWSSRTRYDHGPYVADERMAKALSRGLNREGGAIMPREFRRSHGACSNEDVAAARATQGSSDNPARSAPPTVASVASTSPRCDGRTRCSQMRSCEEATWFLRHCPGVQMDGNRDGVPCERQWCRP